MKVIIATLLIVIFSTDQRIQPPCIDKLQGCNSDGDFCTFGVKWGQDEEFSESGNNAQGPETAGGIVTFTFMGAGHIIRTHSEDSIITKDFESHQIHCAQEQIRKALDEYSRVADIDFSEATTLPADIRFYAASLEVTAVSFPNLIDSSCSDLSGQVVFNSGTTSCHEYYLLALHEIGHALGLGHVTTSNVMKEGIPNLAFTGLQKGDIEGIQSIYGSRSDE